MPRHHPLAPESPLQIRVEPCLELAERLVGRGLEAIHEGGELRGVYLLEVQRAGVVVREALGVCEPVAQAGELAHSVLDLSPDALRGLPGLAAQSRVVGDAQDLAQFVLVRFRAPDDAPMVAVDGVCLGLELLDAPQSLLVALPPCEGL